MTFVMGVDPGFADLGWTVAQWVPESLAFRQRPLVFQTGGVVKTKKTDRSYASDLIFRSMELFEGLRTPMELYKPDVLVVEGFTHPPHANAVSKLSAANAVVACAASLYGPGVRVYLAQDVRKTVLRRKKVPTEAQVHTFLMKKYPEIKRFLPRAKTNSAHVLDACAMVEAYVAKAAKYDVPV